MCKGYGSEQSSFKTHLIFFLNNLLSAKPNVYLDKLYDQLLLILPVF